MKQRQLREWKEDHHPPTTGIDISRMAYAALEIDPPLFPDSFDEELQQRVFRSTEYAIRRTAPNTPDRPEDGTEPHPALDRRAFEEQEAKTVQANLPVVTDGGHTPHTEAER